MADINYYEVLEIDSDADEAQIEAAFKRLSEEYDPEKTAALPTKLRAVAEEEYRKLKAAYDELMDSEKRAVHDNNLLRSGAEEAMTTAHAAVETAQGLGIDIEGPNATLEDSYQAFEDMEFGRTIKLAGQCIEEVNGQYGSVIDSMVAAIYPRLEAAKEAGVDVGSAEDHLESIEVHLEEGDFQKALEAAKMVDSYLEDLKPRYLMAGILKTLIGVSDEVNGVMALLSEANESGMDITEPLQMLIAIRDLINENVGEEDS